MLKKWLHSVFLMLLLGVVANVFADAKAVQKSTPSIFNTANTLCEIKMIVDGLCFTGETPIQLADYSTKLIKEINDGDEVLAYNHKTHKTISQKVKNVFKKTTDSLARVAIGASVFMSTLNHPYYANGKYTEARDLHIGDSVLTVDGDYEKITGFETFDTVATVYNFEVETEHNYFIGEEGLLVHNACAAIEADAVGCRLLELEEKVLNFSPNDMSSFQTFWNKVINNSSRGTLTKRLDDVLESEDLVKFFKDFNGTDYAKFLENPKLVDSWNDLYTAGKTHFAKDIAGLEKYHKLNSEVKGLLVKLSDDVVPANSSIAKFFSDMDDDLITILNANPDFAKGVVGHKSGSLMTKDNFSNLAEELDDFDAISPANRQKLIDAFDRSAGINKFQGFAKLGNDLNTNIKTNLTQSTGDFVGKFNESGHMGVLLKEKFPNKSGWADYDVFEELPLVTTNGYMKGDIVLIKKNALGGVDDVIVIENKLSKGTDLTVRQTEGFGAVKNTSDGLSMKVKYNVENVGGVKIKADDFLLVKKENCLKISDHTTDNINSLSVDDLKLITEFTF